MRKTYIDGKKMSYNMPLEMGNVKKAATGDALGEDIYDVELQKRVE
jgi:hypothetical protein